ncbi:MAG TPA: hypothetical protein PLD27_05905 [bacterium]|nr:hypothetical protein [bacterium]HOL47182.1 hypothetical protein [bacterium]HPQ17674.1 hypothetical protein [bacterium]
MNEKRRAPRYKLKCIIEVSSKKLINGIIDDISKIGVKIRLVDTIKNKEFYEPEINKIHTLKFNLKEVFKESYKAKLIRIIEEDNELLLAYEFLTFIELPEDILEK